MTRSAGRPSSRREHTGRGAHASGPADYLHSWSRFAPAATWRTWSCRPTSPASARWWPSSTRSRAASRWTASSPSTPGPRRAPDSSPGPSRCRRSRQTVTADTAAEFLLQGQYPALEDNEDCIDALESLARATFDRLTTGTSPAPGRSPTPSARPWPGATCTCRAPTPTSRRCSGDSASTARCRPRARRLPRRREQQRGATRSTCSSSGVAYDANWDPAPGRPMPPPP